MARHRRRMRGAVGRPASAFAPKEDRKGKMLSWEYLFDQPNPAAIQVVMPTVVRAVGNKQINLLTLLPVNVTRGAVTLERIRGTFEVWFNSTELSVDFANWPVHLQLQMVPANNGVIDTGAALSPGNAADQESNRIIWQRMYYPNTGTTITGPGAIEYHTSNYFGIEVDIKSKRRFDRSTWGLALVYEVEINAEALHQVSGQLRAIFRASDAL